MSVKNLKELNSRVEGIVVTFQDEISSFRDELKKIASNKSEVASSSNSGMSLDELVNKLDSLENRLMSDVSALKTDMDKLKNNFDESNKLWDSITQRSYCNKLILKGVQERDDEDLYSVISDIFKSNLKSDVNKKSINVCYRIGKKRTEKQKFPRPIVIEFLYTWERNEIYQKKSMLKGTHFLLSEMLTLIRHKLFVEARKIYGNSCWTRNGNILVHKEGVTRRISSHDEIEL